MNSATFLPDMTSALQTVLAVSVLIALVLVARKPVAKHFGAGVAYALWALPLARLVLPPLQIPVSLMPLLGLPRSAPSETAAEPVSAMAVAAAPETVLPMLAVSSPAPAALPVTPQADSAIAGGLAPSHSLADIVSDVLVPGLFFVWAGGALLAFGLSLWRQHVFMQTVKREAVNVSPRLQRVAQQVGAQVGLKRLPVIASSFISSGPLVTGLFRPVVMLPAWFETDYDDTQQRAAIAHELTHVRRGDLWALQLAELFLAAMWFNPLAYYAHRAFRTDQEAACDADVLKTGTASPHAYGATLIKAVKSASQERLPAGAGLPLTHALKERLSRMTHPEPTRARRLAGGTATAVIGAAALIATSSVPANAGEREHRELRMEEGAIFIDGEFVPDRRIIILGEPFEDIHSDPKFDAEIRRLTHEMTREGDEISRIVTRFTANMPALSPEDDADFRALMEELNDLPAHLDLDLENMEAEMSDQDWDVWAEKWEKWGEEFEARAEEWSALHEARAEAFELEMEPKIEQMTLEMESNLEARAAELEALIEKQFGPDFEQRIEATSGAIDELVKECRDVSMVDGDARVMSRTIKTGEGKRTIKIACVKGDGADLRSAKTLALINSSKKLCDVEKKSFRDQVHPDGELDGAEK